MKTLSLQMIKSLMQPQSIMARRAFSAAVAVVVAVICDYYSFAHQYWIPLTTVLMMQITSQANLRQILQYLFIVILGVALISALAFFLQQPLVLQVIAVIGFSAASYWYELDATRWNNFSLPLVLGIIFLLLVVPFPTLTPMAIYDRLHDVVLGGVLALAAELLIFPMRADVDFRAGIVPVLRAYEDYLAAIMDVLLSEPDARQIADRKKTAVEDVLQTQRAMFPDWVYASGFNPALQQGHRHFLIRVELVGQLLFALHYAVRQPIDASLLENFRKPIQECVSQIEKLMALLVAQLELKKISSRVGDVAAEIKQLEEVFRQTIQVPLELLDISKEYIALAAFIEDLKDLRRNLLKMAEALRA